MNGLVGESWKFLESIGYVPKLSSLLGLQAKNHAGVMNRSAAAVVKVVAMAVHGQKTPPQKQAIARQSAASAASEMVDGVCA